MPASLTVTTRVYRSLPVWLALEYLEKLGGRAGDTRRLQGAGWRAIVRDAPDVELGVVRIGQTEIVFEGDAEIVPRIITAFEKKALRAGG